MELKVLEFIIESEETYIVEMTKELKTSPKNIKNALKRLLEYNLVNKYSNLIDMRVILYSPDGFYAERFVREAKT